MNEPRASRHRAKSKCFSRMWPCVPLHPQVILNSEVWDLRTLRLMRSVPSLDGASVMFNGGGDVLYAVGG